MNIQAISAANAPKSCQPLKPVSFAGKKDKVPSFAKEVLDHDLILYSAPSISYGGDSFTPQLSAEDKFDMACLVAGYYKTQYENLLSKDGYCVA